MPLSLSPLMYEHEEIKYLSKFKRPNQTPEKSQENSTGLSYSISKRMRRQNKWK